MQLLIKVYDGLAQEPPICSKDYIMCLAEVLKTTGGNPESAVFSDLIAKGRISLENFVKIVNSIKDDIDPETKNTIVTHWCRVWVKEIVDDSGFLRKAFSNTKTFEETKEWLNLAIMFGDEKLTLFFMVMLLIHRSNGNNNMLIFVDSVAEKLDPPERNLMFFLKDYFAYKGDGAQKIDDACLRFISIWIHSDRPFKTLVPIQARMAFEFIGKLRKCYALPLPPKGAVNPPKITSPTTIESGDGRFILNPCKTFPYKFWGHEAAPAFFFPQCFDFLLEFGRDITIIVGANRKRQLSQQHERPQKILKCHENAADLDRIVLV